MAIGLLLLRNRRREQRSLVHFLQLVSVYLDCGYELGFAWKKAGESVQSPGDFKNSGSAWLEALAELHRAGAPLMPFFDAFIQSQIAEIEREMELHSRTLPLRLNVLLLFFCLPPLFLLLFGPILLTSVVD